MSKRKRRGHKSRTYVPAPEVSEQAARRMAVMVQVMQKQMTEVQAAEELGLSRHRFQVLYNRARTAMVAALSPQAAGRPKTPMDVAKLKAEVSKLQREHDRLKQKNEIFDRMLFTAADVLQGRITPLEARAQTNALDASWPEEETNDEGEDPDPAGDQSSVSEAERRCEVLMYLSGELGLDDRLARALVDVSASTARRWRRRRRNGEAVCKPRGPTPKRPSPEALAQAEHAVETATGRMVGAEALRRGYGLTRRQAAHVKARTLTRMERERKAACTRIEVTRPRLVRGFDQLHLPRHIGGLFLIAGDASIPYRTTVHAAADYTEEEVYAALLADIKSHGAPLVYRLDRHSSHRTDRIGDLLREAGVLALHGPPRHPQYYGQTERQNRDHRAFLRHVGVSADTDQVSLGQRMRVTVNEMWPRCALGWKTPAESWAAAPAVTQAERNSFHERVYDHLSRLNHPRNEPIDHDLAMRLAIEKALTNQGFLRIHKPKSAMAFQS